MRKLILASFVSFISQFAYAQHSDTTFKYSEEEGWVRIIESAGFTLNSNGDTTFWTEKKEDTHQDYPVIKDTVTIKANYDWVSTTVAYQPYHNSVDTVSFYYTKDRIVTKNKYKTRWKKSKAKVIYKNNTRWKKAKQKKIRQVNEVTFTPIKSITYKKRLWCVLSKNKNVYVVEANSMKGAIKKVGSSALLATQFSNLSIIR